MAESEWRPDPGGMYIPGQEFPDLAELQTHEAPLIPGALWIPEAPSIHGDPLIHVTLIDSSIERRLPGLGGRAQYPATDTQDVGDLHRRYAYARRDEID